MFTEFSPDDRHGLVSDAVAHFTPLSDAFEANLVAAVACQRLLVVRHGEVQVEQAHDQVVYDLTVHQTFTHRVN